MISIRVVGLLLDLELCNALFFLKTFFDKLFVPVVSFALYSTPDMLVVRLSRLAAVYLLPLELLHHV